jgi:hypothetical protein
MRKVSLDKYAQCMYNRCMRKGFDIVSFVICIFILSMGIVGLCNYKQQEGLILGIIAVVGSLLGMVYIAKKGWRNGSKKDGNHNQI